MKNKIVEFPFQEYFLDFRKKRSKAEKIHVFKNWLESYVKFNLAIHVSWMLKHKQQNVPINLRVMLVQLFQKPPSIGFCFSIGKFINKELLGDSESDSMWYRWAFWMEKREQNVSRLIELRNMDAHTGASLSDTELLEIEEILQVLLSNPILSNAALVVTSAKDALRAGIHIPDGMEGLKIPIVLLKEGQFFKDEDIVLEGNELPLFPILAAVKIEVTGAVDLEIEMSNENDEVIHKRSVNVSVFDYPLVFWNKRISNKGLYSCYINSDIPDAEVNNITNLSGFPYEDWKRSANPIFLKYLESRDRAMEDMLNDDAVNIDEWYNEYLVAKRLEKEIELKEYEKIAESDYVKGILHKLNIVTDQDVLELYHKRIIELQKTIDLLPEWERSYLAEKIMESLIFLYSKKVKENDRVKYNQFFKQIIDMIPISVYLGGDIKEIIVDVLGGDKKAVIFQNKIKRILWIQYFIFLSVFISGIYFLNTWYAVFFAATYGLITLYIATRNAKKISSIVDQKDYKAIYLNRKLLFFGQVVNKYQYSALKSLKELYSNKNSIEIFEVLTASMDFNDYFNKKIHGNKYLKFVENSFSMNDFERVVFHNKLLYYCILNKSMTISKKINGELVECTLFDLAYHFISGGKSFYLKNEDLLHFRDNGMKSSSVFQESYIYSVLNSIVYAENVIRAMTMINGKIKNKLTNFNTTFYTRTIFYQKDFHQYNYLLGFISSYLADFKSAYEYFKLAYEYALAEERVFVKYNFAQVCGALGLVKEYYLSFLQIESDINNLKEVQLDNINKRTIDFMKNKIHNLKKHLSENKIHVNDLNSWEWTQDMDFTLQFQPMILNEEFKNLKIKFNKVSPIS